MVVYGKQVFFYILQKHAEKIEQIYLAKECNKQIFATIAKSGLKITKLDFKAAQALAKGGNHQGFLMRLKPFVLSEFKELKQLDNLALLCGISDMGNLGAICRSAYALGFDAVLIAAKSLNLESLIRTSAGAALDLKIALIKEPMDALNELKQLNFKLFGTHQSGTRLQKADLKAAKRALIMGSEGEGLAKKILFKCDEVLSIEMKRAFDSLNVSAAFAIICDRMMNE